MSGRQVDKIAPNMLIFSDLTFLKSSTQGIAQDENVFEKELSVKIRNYNFFQKIDELEYCRCQS